MPSGVYNRTDHHRKRLSESHMGLPFRGKRQHSEETKRLMSEIKKNNLPVHAFKKGHVPFNKGGSHLPEYQRWNWKGNRVGYRAMHDWVERHLGKPEECAYCGESDKRLHWANISHKYRRSLEDFVSLCPPCHKKYDMNYRKEMRGNLCR